MKNSGGNLSLSTRYERKSLLGITFYIDIAILLIGSIIGYNYDNIPEWIISIWLRALFLPIALTIIGILIVTLNGSIYLLCKIIGFNYDQTKFAQLVEDIFGSVFPRYLYSRYSPIRSHKNRSIYYGVVINIIIGLCIIIGYIFVNYPDISESINQSQREIDDITNLGKPRSIKIFNSEG